MIELLAPLALANRISSIVVGSALVAFHLANGARMDLWFLNDVFVILVVVVNAPWMASRLVRVILDAAHAVGARNDPAPPNDA